MVVSSSSSASELFMYSLSPNVAAPWLLLLPRTGHLKWLLEKESESCVFLAAMVLMVRDFASLSFYFELAQAFLKQAKRSREMLQYNAAQWTLCFAWLELEGCCVLVLGCVREVISKAKLNCRRAPKHSPRR
uniref:Uncharacterized protein n=1 Tax=Zea mays TaxID=4577 RepID=A0A804Q6G4_MAIZE